MKPHEINKILAKLERLEKRVFGKTSTDEKRIFLSRKGKEQFPELKNAVFFLLRWSRNDPEMIKVRREGKTSIETYHYSFFKIMKSNPHSLSHLVGMGNKHYEKTYL